ncbi:hypothetical protein CBR_g3296 [Chara braunii]|uniref:Uncharacterized protein n=1 Tax=Chara braunii TaxID=69332 RepID=A0A388KFH3_CHABU|nr:hypothetical protein CBR_g3296 [Chara braunii]|eukprot:GBG68756.1 hypothetical protein CBR_g3296 [Chara braunii]
MAAAQSRSETEPGQSQRRQPKRIEFEYLAPLFYAPIFPLIRITLRHKPVLRDRLFTGAVLTALLHGAYTVSQLYDKESK